MCPSIDIVQLTLLHSTVYICRVHSTQQCIYVYSINIEIDKCVFCCRVLHSATAYSKAAFMCIQLIEHTLNLTSVFFGRVYSNSATAYSNTDTNSATLLCKKTHLSIFELAVCIMQIGAKMPYLFPLWRMWRCGGCIHYKQS